MEKFLGWFRPVQRGIREKSFVLTPIVVNAIAASSSNRDRKRVVISVPKSCGNAVKRNRVRRVLRPYLEAQLSKLPERKGLWIRVSKQHCLKKTECLKNWISPIEKAIEKIS